MENCNFEFTQEETEITITVNADLSSIIQNQNRDFSSEQTFSVISEF